MADSPMSDTVRLIFNLSQSHLRDTYSITMEASNA